MAVFMEKCKNLEDITGAFDGQRPLTQNDKDFYVKIYDDKLCELRIEIYNNKIPSKTFYICGQLGNGKSTAMAFIPDTKLCTKFDFLSIGCSELIQDDDTDIVDLLLFIGLKVAEKGKFLDEYYDELNKLKELNLGKLEHVTESSTNSEAKIGVEARSGFKASYFGAFFNASLFAGYKINKNDREAVRKILYIDKTELKKLINDIIHRYEETSSKSEKQLFLILDDLEKIKNAIDIENIFFRNVNLLESLECPKIITIPIFAIRDYSTSSKPDLLNLTTRVTTNPLIDAHQDDELIENIKKLREIVLNRVESGLIDDDAIELAVMQSGGNIRQLLNIVYRAAINAMRYEATKVIKSNVEAGVQNLKNNLAMSAANRIKILRQIHNKHKQFDEPSTDDQASLNNCVKENLVFSYHNGEPWYEVNPLIKNTVEVYSKN